MSEKKTSESAPAAGAKTYEIKVGSQAVVCRQPKRADWRRYLDLVSSDKGKAVSASVTLFSQCLVSPKMADLDPLFDDDPVLETSLAMGFVEQLTRGYDVEGKALSAG